MSFTWGADRRQSRLISRPIVPEPTLKQDWKDYERKNRRAGLRYLRDSASVDDRYDRSGRGRHKESNDG